MSASEDTLSISLTITASPSTPRIPLVLSKTATPSVLRAQASEATSIPIESLRLIFRGRLIAANDTKSVVEEYKLETDCVLHCMGKPVAKKKQEKETAAAVSEAPAPAGSTVSMMAAPAANRSSTSSPLSLPQALTTLRSSNTASVYLTAVTTLQKILTNIISKPLEEKYRKVKQSNAAFHKRLGGLPGGVACMLACGFVQDASGDESTFVLNASPEAWNALVETKRLIDGAVVEAQQMSASSTVPPPAAVGMPTAGMGSLSGGMGAGMPGMGGMPPGMPGMTPDMQRAAAEMMSNPAAMQQMLQDPNTRRMMESDPRIANNPMMRQSLDAMASNPQMLQQMSQMMQDPSMQSRMQQMMGGGGAGMPAAGAGLGGGMPGAGTPAATAPANANNSGANTTNTGGQADQEMTEEEMLEEAIRRSLQEG